MQKIRIIAVEEGVVYYQLNDFYPLNTVNLQNPNKSSAYVSHYLDTFFECVESCNAYVTNPSKLKKYMRPAISYVDAPYRPSYAEFIVANNKRKKGL